MQVLARSSWDGAQPCLLEEIGFIRLTGWQKSDRHTTLTGSAAFGGDIFQRFNLSSMKAVTLDFVSRGKPMCPKTALAFTQVMSKPHVLSIPELKSINEVLREQSIKSGRIELAQVGELNGKKVLIVCWTTANCQFRLQSLYYSANEEHNVVREIHFAAPSNGFQRFQPALFEVMRSIQWQYKVPLTCAGAPSVIV